MGSATFVEVILAILLPPLGVFLRFKCEIHKKFWAFSLVGKKPLFPDSAQHHEHLQKRHRPHTQLGADALPQKETRGWWPPASTAQMEFWICLLLTFFGYLPGIIYALYVLVGR